MRSPAAIIYLLFLLGIGACSSFTAENSSGAQADMPRVYDVDEFLASQPAEYGEVVSIRGYPSTRQEDLLPDRRICTCTPTERRTKPPTTTAASILRLAPWRACLKSANVITASALS